MFILQQDYLVVQKESDVEFWADYSDTETNSDGELGDAVSDLHLCPVSGLTKNFWYVVTPAILFCHANSKCCYILC